MPVSGQGKEIVDIPEGVTITIDDRKVTVKGQKITLERELPVSRITMVLQGNRVVLTCNLPKKKENALLGTFRSHITNMIIGVTGGFEYKMKIVYSHFPVKTTVKGTEFVIENFLGEKHPRIADILGDTKIKVKGDEVIITGPNKEHVGQTAANIEQVTRIKRYDPRIFQDGIYLTQKGGVING
jgi:large subunit ribosomal protein L6